MRVYRFKCRWCKKKIIRGKFCGNWKHKRLFEKFRTEFRAEMHNIKLKPKVSDTEKYKMIRNYLTNFIN